jgi:cysteine-rich repeat protein
MVAAWAWGLAWVGAAVAQDYSFPTSPEDYVHFYPTAYFDSGGHDWNCGNEHYPGHSGQDFGVGSWAGMDAGRDVVAAADGEVVYVHDGEYDRCSSGACGTANWIKVQHADGKQTWYVHLKQWSIEVEVGDVVFCGQKLGLAGSSGNSTGPHLHFTVYSGGTRDAFDGGCSSSPGYWVDQNAYLDVPGRTCDYEANALLMVPSEVGQDPVDVDGDGVSDACARAPGGVSCSLGGASGWRSTWTTTVASDASGWDQPEHYLTMRAGDVNGDGLTDVCARGNSYFYCWNSTGTGFGGSYAGPAWSDTSNYDEPEYYSTIRLLDVDGDGRDDACVRASSGVSCALSNGAGFGALFSGPAWTDASGYNDDDNYGTIRAGDFTGDGRDDLCVRANSGMRCYASTGNGFGGSVVGPTWDDAGGFAGTDQFSTIRMADIDGDGLDDLCARTSAGFRCHLSTGAGFGPERTGPAWSDAAGWSDADNYGSLQLGDVDGDGSLDVCGRANATIVCALWDGDGHDIAVTGPDWSDTRGYGEPDHWRTFRLADVSGDGLADVCIRAGSGYTCAPSLGASFGPSWSYNGWTDAAGFAAPEHHTTVIAGSERCYDSDGDLASDCAESCPADPSKTEPGLCGCGLADADSDGDGAIDCDEACPYDPDKLDPGACGCGAPDLDGDLDGAADCVDGCPSDPTKADPGVCGCGAPEVDWNGDGVIDCTSCGDGLRDPAEGCDDGGVLGGDGCSAVCEVEPLSLGAWSPGIAGQTNTLRARGATPGASVVLLGSLRPGSQPVAGCPGLFVPLDAPWTLATSTGLDDTRARFSVRAPPILGGQVVRVVALEPSTCRMSPMMRQTFGP